MGNLFSSTPKQDDVQPRHRKDSEDEQYEDLRHLLKTKEGSDIVLRFAGETLDVHSRVLTAHSDTFKAIINSLDGIKNEIVIEFQPLIVHYMINFLYSGKLPEGGIRIHYALKLYEASKNYDIHALQKNCLKMIKEDMKDEHVLDILMYCHSKKMGELKDIALSHIVQNKDFLLTEVWRQFADRNQDLVNDVVVAMAKRIP